MTAPLICATTAMTIPYHFEEIDFSSYSGPALPTIDLSSIDFINTAGSIAITMYKMLEDYAFIGYFVLIFVALLVIFWIWVWVTDRPGIATINATEAFNNSVDLYAGYENRSLSQENAVIESRGFLDKENERYGLASSTVSLNKSLMQSNTANAAKFKSSARVFKKISRLKW